MQNKRGCKPFPTARECRRQALSQKRQRKQNFPSTCVTSPIPMHYKTYTQNHVCKNVRNRPYSAVNKAFSRFKQGSFICKTRLFYPATKPYLQHDNASAKPKLHLTNLKTPLFTLRNSCLLHGSRNFFAPQNAYICNIDISHFEHIRDFAATRKVSTRTPAMLHFFVNGQKNETFLARKQPYSKKIYYFCRTKNKPAAPHGDTQEKASRTACGGRMREIT